LAGGGGGGGGPAALVVCTLSDDVMAETPFCSFCQQPQRQTSTA